MARARHPENPAAPRARGRPRAFDPDVVLSRARDTFWQAGVAGTSLDALAAAMAMNRPSITAAFGDKQALYVRTLEIYARRSCAALEIALQAQAPLRDRLLDVYRSAIQFYLQGGPAVPRGCFLVGTALTEALPSLRVRSLLERTFSRFTELFEQAFRAARARGELSGAASPEGLAAIATAALNTLSLRARTGASRAILEQLATATIDVICGASGAGPQAATRSRRTRSRKR